MAGNMFLKLETPEIKGESGDDAHKDEIHVLSWSHHCNQPTSTTRTSAGGGTVEQANHGDFTFMKYTDSASDDLLKQCWSGKSIGKGTFTAFRANGDNKPVKYLEITMEDIIVSQFSVSSGMGDIPQETVALNYGKITYSYIPQKKDDGTADGAQPVSHDLIKQAVS